MAFRSPCQRSILNQLLLLFSSLVWRGSNPKYHKFTVNTYILVRNIHHHHSTRHFDEILPVVPHVSGTFLKEQLELIDSFLSRQALTFSPSYSCTNTAP